MPAAMSGYKIFSKCLHVGTIFVHVHFQKGHNYNLAVTIYGDI